MAAKRTRTHKAWSGRMAEATHPLVEAFTTSYPVDCRLFPYDIAGSIAHARMLAKQRIIPARDAGRIVAGLGRIRRERNQTILMATHSPEAAAICDRVVRLRDGRIVADA